MERRRPRVRPAACESPSGEKKKRFRPDDKLQIKKKFSFVVEKLFSYELMKAADVFILACFLIHRHPLILFFCSFSSRRRSDGEKKRTLITFPSSKNMNDTVFTEFSLNHAASSELQRCVPSVSTGGRPLPAELRDDDESTPGCSLTRSRTRPLFSSNTPTADGEPQTPKSLRGR